MLDYSYSRYAVPLASWNSSGEREERDQRELARTHFPHLSTHRVSYRITQRSSMEARGEERSRRRPSTKACFLFLLFRSHLPLSPRASSLSGASSLAAISRKAAGLDREMDLASNEKNGAFPSSFPLPSSFPFRSSSLPSSRYANTLAAHPAR